MNHTIRGIIIVVVITSMLVVGATTVPIMQNSFAHKRSDFKGAERDPNTNTNTNTNSADSSSSSTATSDNTNNITNTATASSNQNQNACAVAVTCPQGSTTVTPPATGTLQISKVCDPGSITACGSVNFAITVTDNNPQPSSFNLNNGDTQSVTLGSGSFTIHEDSQGFIPTFTGDCKQTEPGSEDATGTISAGQTLHCTITNTQPGTLNIRKICVPPCPGATFPITVTGTNPVIPPSFTLSAGQTQVVTLGPGTFTVTESVPAGFLNPAFVGACLNNPPTGSPTGTGTIIAGQTKNCDILNVHQ
jgi:hypothetical protein